MWASLKTHYQPKQQRHGFTIVELLIVVVVIAILAAITIVAYNGIQNRVKISAVQSAVSQANKKVLTYAPINADQYPPNLAAVGINDGDVTYQYSVNNATSPKAFCITATKDTLSYFISSTAPTPASGACPGHGSGGISAITNIFANPGSLTTGGFTSFNGVGGVSSFSTSSVSWTQSGKATRATWTTVPTNPTDGDIGINVSLFITPGVPYTLVYKLNSNKNGVVSVPSPYASSGTYSTISRSPSTAQSVTAGTPVTRSITFTGDATSISSGLRIVQSLQSKSTNDWMEIGDVILVQGSTIVNFADGSSPNWVWNGTANSSSSTGPPL